jgi:uncharacterized protein (DUF697 family)
MMPRTIEELEEIRAELLRMSQKKAFLSAAVSVVPLPFMDVVADVALLQRIIPAVSERYGLSKGQIDGFHPQLAIMIYDMAKKLGANMIGKYVTRAVIMKALKGAGIRLTARQAARYVPVIGQTLTAGMSYAAMRAIIRSHINKCHEIARTVVLMEQGVTIMEDTARGFDHR